MSTSLNQLILANAPTGQNGSYTQVTSVNVPATGTALVPVGVWMMSATSGVAVQVQTTTSGTWATVHPQNTGGMFFSDGYNTQFTNSSGAAVTGTIYGPGSAQTAGSTYNK